MSDLDRTDAEKYLEIFYLLQLRPLLQKARQGASLLLPLSLKNSSCILLAGSADVRQTQTCKWAVT